MSCNTQRTELYKVLPLKTPFSVHIFPSYYCNFRCNYCLHSLGEDVLKEKGFKRQFMDMEIFKKAIDGACEFEEPVKALIFAGHGEPLMHKEIADMVAYAKKTGRFGRIEIVTNGSLLTHELSDRLIEAGLDRLRVSLQGTDAEDYRKVSDVKIDFDSFVEQLEYFYKHKTNTEVYIKIIDIALKDKDDEKKFYEIFRPVADIAAVEYAIPFVNEIDYSNVGELSEKNKQGNTGHSEFCSMPFYMAVVLPDGNVAPCCATDIPLTYGNLKDKTLKEIWDSKNRNAFLIRQLWGASKVAICNNCSVPSYGLQEGDYLDGHEKEIMERLVK